MLTKRQEELVNSFLSTLGEELAPPYRGIILYLDELGYHPHKEKSSISFKHDLHNKQMAKIGTKNIKKAPPFIALRFSACRGYSQRFADIVSAAIVKSPTRAARCTDSGCDYCAGDPDTHVYTHTFADGETKTHCGAYALEIPDITSEDADEIKELIKQEHAYLLKYQVGVSE